MTFVSSVPRRILLGTGTLFVDDVAEALRREGYEVHPLATTQSSLDELHRTVDRVRPDAIFHINYVHGLAEFCAERGVPLRCWEIDPATDRVRPVARPGDAVIYTYRKAHVAEWNARGLPSVYLPLATNPARRTPGQEIPRGISFVGASMVHTAHAYLQQLHQLAASRDPNPDRVRAAFAAILEEQARSPGWIADRLLDAVYPGLPSDRHEPGMMLGEVAASEHRLNAVARLARLGVEVWGDEGWKLLEARGVRYRGPAGHFRQLNEVYRSTLVNVDIGRAYQPDIVTMRVFDALACGGFVLAADCEAIHELFVVGEELDTWRTFDELAQKAEFYLRNPEVARRMAARGRERVLRDHTIDGRVRWMVQAGR
jgi:hypothetical protein